MIQNNFKTIKYEILSTLDTGYIDIEKPKFKPVSKFISDKPHDFVNQFNIKFFALDELENEVYLGELYANHIKILEAIKANNVTLYEIFERHDDEMLDLYNTVMDTKTDYFKLEIDVGTNADIFFIYDLEIELSESNFDIAEIIFRNLPNILRYNRDIWLGAIFYKTADFNMRRILIESGFNKLETTDYLYLNPENMGYYDSFDEMSFGELLEGYNLDIDDNDEFDEKF